MDAFEHLRHTIEANDLNKAQLARAIGWSKERLHYLLTYGKSIDQVTYSKLRRAIEDNGIRVDDLDTMSITGLAAHVNSEACHLVQECIQSLTDGVLTPQEKDQLQSGIAKMVTDLNALREKL